MVKICLLKNEKLNTELMYFSIDSMGKYIMSNDFVSIVEVNSDKYMEDVVHVLNALDSTTFMGDCDTVFFSPDQTFKMIHYSQQEKLEVNLIASILHPEGLTTRGYAVVLKFINKQLVDLTKEDIIFLLIKRREHSGLHILNGTVSKVTLDNRWHLLENNMSLGGKIKKIVPVYNYFLLIISDKPCDFDSDSEKYLFSLLDKNKKVIVDLSQEEYELLIKRKDEIFSKDEVFDPYQTLKAFNS